MPMSEIAASLFRIADLKCKQWAVNQHIKELTASNDKAKTCTDKVLNRNMVVGGKMTYSKKTIGDKVLEQQKWVQLIKCN